jgi:apolipoprotein N-acyltransferase
MISGAERFTGYNSLYGLAVFILCAVIIAVYWGSLLWCFAFLKSKVASQSVFMNGVLIAACFCVAEYLWSFISEGMPWFNFFAGNALEGNMYAVQPLPFLERIF